MSDQKCISDLVTSLLGVERTSVQECKRVQVNDEPVIITRTVPEYTGASWADGDEEMVDVTMPPW